METSKKEPPTKESPTKGKADVAGRTANRRGNLIGDPPDQADSSGSDDGEETQGISAEHLLNCPLIPMVIQRDLFKYFLQKLKVNSPVESKNVLSVLLYREEASGGTTGGIRGGTTGGIHGGTTGEPLMKKNRNVLAYTNVRTYEQDVISSYVLEHIATVLSKKKTTPSHPLAFLLHPGRADPLVGQAVENTFEQKVPANFIKRGEPQRGRSARGANKVYYSNYESARGGQQDGRQDGQHDDQNRANQHKANPQSDDQQSSERGDIPIEPRVAAQETETPPWGTKKKNAEAKKCPVLNRPNQRVLFIDKNNKLLYVPFYLTESYRNAIPQGAQGKSFSSSFFFSQNHFLQSGRQETVRRENSLLYSTVVRVGGRGDLHFGASAVGVARNGSGARKVGGTRNGSGARKVGGTRKDSTSNHVTPHNGVSNAPPYAPGQDSHVNLPFCVYQLMTLQNVLSILHSFKHYLGRLTIKWSCTHMLIQIIRDVLSPDEEEEEEGEERARFIFTHLQQPNVKYKSFKKLLYSLNLTCDEKILKLFHSVVTDTSDTLTQRMHKIKKMYFMVDHCNKNAISCLTSTVIYLESLFEHFNTSKNAFVWDFFMSEYEQVFSFSFAFAVYSDADRGVPLSIGGVSMGAFSPSAERPPGEPTYNFVYEIFVDAISALILQKVRRNNCASMPIDFHSPSVVITTKAYKLLVYAFSLYNSLIQNGIKCECKISPLVETSKFEQGLLKYGDINIHVQITQKVNSNTSLNIEDYEGSAETITSNIVGEENVNIMYSTHIIRLNVKKNFENESSLINYIKQFYAKR